MKDAIEAAFMAAYGWIEDAEARDAHRPDFVAGYAAAVRDARGFVASSPRGGGSK